jgi:hypothetical protein
VKYARIETSFRDHPRFLEAGLEAAGLWACALAFCRDHLTDGFVTEAAVMTFLGGGRPNLKVAAKLVKCGLFEKSDVDGKPGFSIVDYALNHETRAEIEETTRRGTERGRAWDLRARDGYVCHLCRRPVDPSDVHVDHIVPLSRGGDSQLANLAVSHSKCNLQKGARI